MSTQSNRKLYVSIIQFLSGDCTLNQEGEANPEPDQITLENKNKIKILEILESSPHSTDFT